MSTELALTESPTLRAAYVTRTEVLDRVQGFTLPDGREWLTAEELAHGVDGQSGFGVDVKTIRQLSRRHGEELRSNGLTLLTYEQQKLHDVAFDLVPRGLLVYPRRATLNVAMLLRDSEVARTIRTYLLDAEERSVTQVPATPVRHRMPRFVSRGLKEDRIESCQFDKDTGRVTSVSFRTDVVRQAVGTTLEGTAMVTLHHGVPIYAECEHGPMLHHVSGESYDSYWRCRKWIDKKRTACGVVSDKWFRTDMDEY